MLKECFKDFEALGLMGLFHATSVLLHFISQAQLALFTALVQELLTVVLLSFLLEILHESFTLDAV